MGVVRPQNQSFAVFHHQTNIFAHWQAHLGLDVTKGQIRQHWDFDLSAQPIDHAL